MSSSTLLVQAASGLEKLMVGNMTGHIKDSTVAQISAAVYYQSHVMAKLMENKQFQRQFNSVIFNQISNDFGKYIDAKARTNPKSLHHVYEWNKVGVEESRLFKLKKMPSDGLNIRITHEFKLSKTKVPSKARSTKYIFAKKASVMEAGMPVIISPRTAERLVFEINGYVVFMPKGASVTVTRPGGARATNQFKLAYSQFFTGNLVNVSIKNSGFQKLFNSSISKSMKIPANIKKVQYKFSANTIRTQAETSLDMAFGGV